MRTALFVLLLLPLALAQTLPSFARVIAGRAPHVCHCAIDHSDCVCPICHPDRDLDEDDAGDARISGRCGDPDLVYGARFGVAIAAPDFALEPASIAAPRVEPPASIAPEPRASSPPLRPPKA